MYTLYAQNMSDLQQLTGLFDAHMEPLLQNLDGFYQQNGHSKDLQEIGDYLQVCRWPFRRLEYSFVLDALLDFLKPGSRFLDAGCGVTPLAHVFAARGVAAQGCDFREEVIDHLNRLHLEEVYQSKVDLSAEDLSRLSYADETFDAIACVSVLEHIPSPQDQAAVKEMLRVLKPGGWLVLTVDYIPPFPEGNPAKSRYLLSRLFFLLNAGRIDDFTSIISRKTAARSAVKQGKASFSRSANQCFEPRHLESDIFPHLSGKQIASRLSFQEGFAPFSHNQIRQFWSLEDDLFNHQGKRYVLPAAVIIEKG